MEGEAEEMTEEEEFEFRARMEQEQATPKRRLSDYGPTWGEGFAKLVDKFAYGAGGKVTDLASAAGASPEVAGGAGYATNVVAQAIPTLLTGASAKTAGAPLMEKAAEFTMQSALKPSSKSLANGDAAKAIDTMLAEGVNATAGGAAKLRLMITKLKGEVGKVISDSPGALVDKTHVYKELASLLDELAPLGERGKASADAVRKAWEQFKNHSLFRGETAPIPLPQADEIKRAFQKEAKDAYGRTTRQPIDDRIDMATAAGMRKGMEAAEPAVASMNAKLSQYINALHQIEPRAAIAANRDLGGLVPLASSAEGAMLMLADRNPWLKSYIARVLHAGRERMPQTAGQAAAAALVSEHGRQE